MTAPFFASLGPLTELDAVNSMLSAIGEQPVTTLATPTPADVTLAKFIVRQVAAQVLQEGWRFNTELGFELAPNADSPFTWANRDASTVKLNIFEPPADHLWVRTSKVVENRAIDMTLRKSRVYTAGAPLAPVLVFYDRFNNRDGLLDTDHPFLFIDYAFTVDFDDMPAEAKTFITMEATRRFVKATVGSSELVNFTDQDFVTARLQLDDAEGEIESISLLDNAEISRARGGRPSFRGVLDDGRGTINI